MINLSGAFCLQGNYVEALRCAAEPQSTSLIDGR
jgi:hypothetical protein